MVAVAFYRAGFEEQLTGSALGPVNCNSASGAMLADEATLGLQNPTPDQFRRNTGDTSGGMPIATIGETLEHHYGVGVTVYDASDGYTFDKLVLALKRGQHAIVNGDYAVVPHSLAGSKTFDGYHSEYWHSWTAKGIVVADPLCDGRPLPGGGRAPKGYVLYPLAIARKFVEQFDHEVVGRSIHCAIMDLKRLKPRSGGTTNIRVLATRKSAILGTFRGTQTLVWGGTVKGESIGGNNVWYRVWFPAKAKLAYVHSSVVTKV
jgi:hypothetical protein